MFTGGMNNPLLMSAMLGGGGLLGGSTTTGGLDLGTLALMGGLGGFGTPYTSSSPVYTGYASRPAGVQVQSFPTQSFPTAYSGYPAAFSAPVTAPVSIAAPVAQLPQIQYQQAPQIQYQPQYQPQYAPQYIERPQAPVERVKPTNSFNPMMYLLINKKDDALGTNDNNDIFKYMLMGGMGGSGGSGSMNPLMYDILLKKKDDVTTDKNDDLLKFMMLSGGFRGGF